MGLLINKVIAARNTLRPLMEQRLPVKFSYQIANFLSKTDSDEQFYWDKVREVVQECGQKDENGQLISNENGNILITPEFTEQCTQRIKEIEQIESDATLNISEEDIMNLDGKVELTPIEIKTLLDLAKGE